MTKTEKRNISRSITKAQKEAWKIECKNRIPNSQVIRKENIKKYRDLSEKYKDSIIDKYNFKEIYEDVLTQYIGDCKVKVFILPKLTINWFPKKETNDKRRIEKSEEMKDGESSGYNYFDVLTFFINPNTNKKVRVSKSSIGYNKKKGVRKEIIFNNLHVLKGNYERLVVEND